MKVLQTDQQNDLINLFESLINLTDPEGFVKLTPQMSDELTYWSRELQPKRVRRKTDLVVDNPSEA